MKLLFLILLINFLACNRMPEIQPCPTDIACTEEFRTIGVTITQDNQPLNLDRYTVTTEGEALELDNNLGMGSGWHTLFTDAFQKTYQNREITLSLKGYLGTEMVVNQDYVVGADCCHIYLVSGPEEISLP